MKVYELKVYYNGGLTEHHLYPTKSSALYHACQCEKIEGTTDGWLLVWVRDKDSFVLESADPVFTK